MKRFFRSKVDLAQLFIFKMHNQKYSFCLQSVRMIYVYSKDRVKTIDKQLQLRIRCL